MVTKETNKIYKIVNTVNEKVYIGLTTQKLQYRLSAHLRHAINYNEDTKFCRAIRKYGVGCFSIIHLFTVFDIEDLFFFERKFIKEYDSYKNGYNSTHGAEDNGYDNPTWGIPRSKDVKEKSRKKQSIGIWHTPFGDFLSATQISKETEFSYSTIHSWCTNYWKKVSKISVGQCEYLKKLNFNPVGMTYKELGFWLERK